MKNIISGIFVAVMAGLILYVLLIDVAGGVPLFVILIAILILAIALVFANSRLRRFLGAKDEVPESESELDRLIREHFRKSTIRLMKEKIMSVVCFVLRNHNRKWLGFSPYGGSASYGHYECSRCGKRLP